METLILMVIYIYSNMETPPKNGYLPRKTYFWITGIMIGLIVTIVGSVLSYQTGKIDKIGDSFNHSFSEVKEDISELNVSVGRLDINLELLRESLK